jgi:hydroxylaminobenzene mutase
MKTQKRRLMWHGMLLFLLGLITGLLEQRFTNVRMGLSAHLEGVMNGILLLRSVPHGTRYGCLIR